jgi:hypothetical protein
MAFLKKVFPFFLVAVGAVVLYVKVDAVKALFAKVGL